MKRLRMIILFVFVVAILFGCATGRDKYIPDHAMKNPADGVSIPHPVEAEKAGTKKITTFTFFMNPDLWVEVVGGGGVWPILGSDGEKEFRSYSWMSGISHWGDFLLQASFQKTIQEIAYVKFISYNRDAGWAYKLNGEKIPEDKYDPKSFDNDPEYRKKVFSEFGTNFEELDACWKTYFRSHGLNLPEGISSVKEIELGTKEWETYKQKVASMMKSNPKMGNGEIRSSFLPLEEFKKVAVENPGFNGGSRFVKQGLNIPLLAVPFASTSIIIAAAASLAGDVARAGINDDYSSYYARSTVLRIGLKDNFHTIVNVYKELLRERDRIINER
ncbi:MAG: hypothetical protein NT136_02665 [Candidatus Moranbacteria bacterium]|nr:hypothetical protein [Candidatus Moranbacteria bacterium]